ncbi:DUF4245 family protein [Nocardioides sp. TF02-7]|uniref:DUF4245 family protein n=1 Tax=Nocardioides sp. TF02-7 TaxID=2917724 RepID=UPI001F05C115|nr:DUF4245 family protein [Nocardioides sp. TF02-7]UMG91426.1 DUF4245 domain-containing protein [Nocardioides sp. TF02-7]
MSTTQVGRPGKYQRSFGGMVGALLLVVLGVALLLWLLGLFRSDLEVEPDQVDHLRIAAEAQDSGLDPVYPATLPEGWTATAFDVEAGTDPVFEIRLLTDEERFVGIHEEDAPVSDLLDRYVVEDADPIDPYGSPDSVAGRWSGYADGEGDTAYAAEVGGRTVLVWGSAPAAELQDVIDRLTDAPVERQAP